MQEILFDTKGPQRQIVSIPAKQHRLHQHGDSSRKFIGPKLVTWRSFEGTRLSSGEIQCLNGLVADRFLPRVPHTPLREPQPCTLEVSLVVSKFCQKAGKE